jgi:hypothetical protein
MASLFKIHQLLFAALLKYCCYLYLEFTLFTIEVAIYSLFLQRIDQLLFKLLLVQ